MLHFSALATAAVSGRAQRRPSPSPGELLGFGGCSSLAAGRGPGAWAGLRGGGGEDRGGRALHAAGSLQPREIKLAAVAPAGAPAAAKAAGGDLARGRGSAPGRPSPAPRPSGRRLLPGWRRGAAVESSRWRVFPLPGEGRGARGRAACGPRAS